MQAAVKTPVIPTLASEPITTWNVVCGPTSFPPTYPASVGPDLVVSDEAGCS